jgi:hypothetical protein
MKTLPCIFIAMILFTAAARSQDTADERHLYLNCYSWPWAIDTM